jgi:hypothetical protein
MNKDNLIVIKGGSHSDIKKALQQWIELYSDDLETDIKFELYKTGQENHLIVADKRLNNEKFNFLVNYLRYPEDVEYKISIEGYTTAKKEKLYPENIQNKRLLIYMSESDKEFDNVFVTTEDNETYKVDFGGKITRIIESKTFKIPDIDFDSLSRPEKITFNKTEIEDLKKEKSIKGIEKRFKIILFIIIALTIINALSLFVIENFYIETVTSFFLSFGIGGWLLGDYEILQIKKYYNFNFLIAIGIFCYGILIRHLIPFDNYISKFGFLFPLALLIIQKPLRLVYIRKFNKEPIVEKEAPIFWDGIYSFILFISTIAIIFVFRDVMK